jgi:tetratricopeptide (TPR) repeat protein
VNLSTAARLAALLAASTAIAGCSFGRKSTEELRAHANEAFVREEYKRAVAFDTEILRREPNDYQATIQRGVAYDRLGSVSDAQQDSTTAIELAPEAGLPRLYRANLALKSGQVEAASGDVQALDSLDLPKHERVAAFVLQGTFMQRKGDHTSALRCYAQAIEAGRGDPDPATSQHFRDALHNSAECYYRMGAFDRAAELYAELIQTKTRDGDELTEDDCYTFVVLRYLRGDFGKAREMFGHVSPERRRKAAQLLNDEGFFAAAR